MAGGLLYKQVTPAFLLKEEYEMTSTSVRLPYGRSYLEVSVDPEHLNAVLQPGLHGNETENTADAAGEALTGAEAEMALIQDALENPIGSPRLKDLAAGKEKIVIIASDHTRPVPSEIIMPLILSEIRKGNPDADITILIATGLHRTTTVDELTDKFGAEITSHEKIVVHDCDDRDNLVTVGTLPSGGTLVLNRLAVEADLLVAEGFIEPHFFAGFSGGRKSVLPGIAARETVMYNHNSRFIADPGARTGNLEGNPIHIDMVSAAETAKLAFIVNVVINAQHRPIFAAAGDFRKAHDRGVAFLLSRCQVTAAPADIVVTTNGGYPLDQNVYQSVKGMTAAEAVVRPGGVIIMVSKCEDGHGGENFHRTFREADSLPALMDSFLARNPEDTIIDQWQSQIFVRVLLKARVIFVSDCSDDLVKDFHMTPAHSMAEAMDLAIQMVGKPDYTVNVIPDGVSVIAK